MLLASTLLAVPAAAVQSTTLGVYPAGKLNSPQPWFTYRLNPGSSERAQLTIENRSGDTQEVALYAVDAAPNGDGGFGMAPRAEPVSDAGGWIRISASRLTLAPHSLQEVGLTLTVPTTASVGPHYAGVVVEPANQPAGSGSLRVVKRLGVRVYLTVNGEQRPRLAITSIRMTHHRGRVRFLAAVHNQGNTVVAPHGQLRFRSWLTTKSLPVNLGRGLKPGETAVITIPGVSHLLPGHYSASLELEHAAQRSTTFWLTDWLLLLMTATLVLLVVAVLYQRAARNRQRHRRQPQ